MTLVIQQGQLILLRIFLLMRPFSQYFSTTFFTGEPSRVVLLEVNSSLLIRTNSIMLAHSQLKVSRVVMRTYNLLMNEYILMSPIYHLATNLGHYQKFRSMRHHTSHSYPTILSACRMNYNTDP